jgi:GGDEF domain-containing protein
MPAKTVTVDQLHADYAQTIADETGLDPADYTRDAAGLANLLYDATDGVSEQVGEWLGEAATALSLVPLLGDDPKTQDLLRRADQALYAAKTDLA